MRVEPVNGPAPDIPPDVGPRTRDGGIAFGDGWGPCSEVVMAEYRFSALVDAPPERVFALWMDLDRMREWVGGVSDVTDVTGPIDRPGTRYTVWFGRVASPTEILEVERPTHVLTRFGNFVLKGESETRFDAHGNGTRITQTIRTRGLVSAISARVFATGSFEGSFRGELEAFRQIAEREARG